MTLLNTFKLSADAKSLDLMIFGDIGMDFFGDGVSAANIVATLIDAKDVTAIDVTINSPGGSAFDGLAIYNALRAHPATVTTNVQGMAASAASIVMLAGDTINMSETAMAMIHKSIGGPGGNADEKRKAADMQDKLDLQMATIYADRMGGTVESALELMAAETWFTAAEARKAGLIDTITEPLDIAAHADVSGYGYRHAPVKAVAPKQITAPPAQTETSSMKIFAQAAGLPDSATDAEILQAFNARDVAHVAAFDKVTAQLTALTAAIGEEGDAALGQVEAFKASHAALADTQAQLKAIADKTEADRHVALIEQGKAAGQLPKDLETLAASWTSEALEAFLKAAPKVVPLDEGVNPPAPAPVATDDGELFLKHDGKTYAEMTGAEKLALVRENPEIAKPMIAQFRASIPGNINAA